MALVVGASPLLASAADHLDAPAAKADHRVDITDVYAFKSSAGHTTLVLDVDGFLTPADSKVAAYRTNSLYEIKVDRNQDGKADLAYRVRFSPATTNGDGTKTQAYVVRRDSGASANSNVWKGKVVAEGRTTPYKHAVRTAHVKHGGSVFAGTRDDPFFFDLPGFIEFKEQLLGGSTDLGDLLGGFTGMDAFAGHERPLDRHQAAEQPARRQRELDRRLGHDVGHVQRWLVADRPHGSAGDQHRVQRPAPALRLAVQRPGEGRLQLPAPDQ